MVCSMGIPYLLNMTLCVCICQQKGKHWKKAQEANTGTKWQNTAACEWLWSDVLRAERLFLPYFFSRLLFPLMLRGHVDIECQLVFSTLAALTVTRFIINIVNTYLFINSAAVCAWLTNALCTFNRYLSLMLWNHINKNAFHTFPHWSRITERDLHP